MNQHTLEGLCHIAESALKRRRCQRGYLRSWDSRTWLSMFIHHWLTLGQPCGQADEPPPGSFSLSGHIRFPFHCFMSVLAPSPPSRWVSLWVFLAFIHPSSVRQTHWEQWSQREPRSQILKHKHSENRRGPLQMSTSLHNSLEPLLKIYDRPPPSPCSSSTLSSLSPYDRGEAGELHFLK